MGIDKIILFLPLLIVALVIGIMIGWLIAFGVGFLGVAATLFITGVLNNSPVLSFSAIPFLILCLLCAFESARRIIARDNFKSRITDYIAEGQRIFTNNSILTISTTDYITLVKNWSKKVSEDIKCHKGQAETESFLAEASTREYYRLIDDNAIEEHIRRSKAAQIVGTQKYQLILLRERL